MPRHCQADSIWRFQDLRASRVKCYIIQQLERVLLAVKLVDYFLLIAMTSPEVVSLICNECNSLLCISSNAWHEVSKSYSSYENASYYSHPGLEQVAEKRAGARELEGCFVCELRCIQCKTSIGVKCVDGPGKKEEGLM